MRRFGPTSAALIAALALSSCGGGEEPQSQAPEPSTSTNQSATLPSSADGFAAMCRRQVGFPGAAPYSQEPGVHPTVLFDWDADSGFQHVIGRLPAKWTVKDEAGTVGQSELARVELVACQRTISTTPTGKVCRFQSDGEEVKLDLLLAQDELTVYEAATGEQVASLRLPQPRPICPMLWMPEEGETTAVLIPQNPAIRAALRPFVNP